ncbi:ComEC/Rec2 family competence protein [candidate division WOR-3 bacterium]|nr:ComEC/Rec2 family competence protein [candidate division WOR-3 bacterium]
MDIKKTLKKRPAFTIFLVLLTGLYSGYFLDIRIFLIGLFLSIIGFLIKRKDIALLIVLFFSAGVFQSSRIPPRGQIIYFRGFYLNNRIIDPVFGELYAKIPANCGDFVKGSGKFTEIRGFSKLTKVESIKSSPTILNKLFSLRKYLDKRIRGACPGDIGEMCSAITLGVRESLPSYTYKRFQTCGAAHLLAVSGLHTGIVFAVIFLFLKVLQLKRNPALLISGFFVLIYAVFTGLRLPVMRASIMLLFFVIGESREKNIDPLNTLCAAGIFISLLMPGSIFSISFQLSFLAVFSILIMFNILKEYLEKIPNKWYKKWIIIPFFLTLSAQLGTLPLVAYYFGYIPLIGLIANLILIPLTGALISGCFIFFLLPPLRGITGNFTWIIGFTMNKTMITIEKIPYVIIKVKKNEPLLLIIYLFYLIFLLTWAYRKTKQNNIITR